MTTFQQRTPVVYTSPLPALAPSLYFHTSPSTPFPPSDYFSLCALLIDLPPPPLPRLAPGKMHHRHHKETITVIRNPRKRVIPRHEGRQEREEATRLDDGRVGLAGGGAVEVADPQEHEGQVEGEEEGEEGDGGF